MMASELSSRRGDLLPIEQVLADPAASDWLKAALRSALSRDPVDVATRCRGARKTPGSPVSSHTRKFIMIHP